MPTVPFAAPPAGGHIIGQPFTISDLAIPVTCLFTCNCQPPAQRVAMKIIASAPVTCEACQKTYAVAFNPANNQIMVMAAVPDEKVPS